MDSIHNELNRIERRETHLWFLVLGLLLLLALIVAGRIGITLWWREAAADAGMSGQTLYALAVTLLFLVSCLCLYVVNTLLLNGRMKGLLSEMNQVAACSLDLDDLLPSIARRIANTSSVMTCQIALFEHKCAAIRVRSAYARGDATQQPKTGILYQLEPSSVCRRAAESARPIVLNRRDVEELSHGGADFEVLTGGLKNIHSILIVPMANRGRTIGLMILGRSPRMLQRGFNRSTVAKALAVSRYAAAAIEQAQLKREAIHDPLTNLYNRRYFSERLKDEIERADRNGGLAAVLLCDLDRFKAVNDTHGHQVGDDVLRKVAKSIQASTRGLDLVFRWGGDEIVVILSGTSREGTLIVADRIRRGVREAVELDIDVSIGIALYPDHGRDENSLIRTADRALYIAKKTGEKVRIGEEDYQLDLSVIKVVFQPVVDVASNRIVGYEALTRDPHGKLTVYELFEKYRSIGRINELKQLTLTSQIEAARLLGLHRVFINVDFLVLSRVDPVPKPSGLNVVLELSELEALHDLDDHLTVAKRWRDHGYQFAIDDFGAGFISLPFLAMLVPEFVKLDRSTMLHAVASKTFSQFLKPLLRAVQTYAVEGIIAEGVEREDELALVEELGITLVQGYLFGRPQELTGPLGLDRAPRSTPSMTSTVTKAASS